MRSFTKLAATLACFSRLQDLGVLGNSVSSGRGTPDSPLVRPSSDIAPIWAGTALHYLERPKGELYLAAPRDFAPA